MRNVGESVCHGVRNLQILLSYCHMRGLLVHAELSLFVDLVLLDG